MLHTLVKFSAFLPHCAGEYLRWYEICVARQAAEIYRARNVIRAQRTLHFTPLHFGPVPVPVRVELSWVEFRCVPPPRCPTVPAVVCSAARSRQLSRSARPPFWPPLWIGLSDAAAAAAVAVVAVGRVAAIRRAYKLHPAGRTLATPRLPDWTLTNACIYFLLCSSRGRGRARSSSIHHRHRHRHLLLLLLQAAPRCSNNSWWHY